MSDILQNGKASRRIEFFSVDSLIFTKVITNITFTYCTCLTFCRMEQHHEELKYSVDLNFLELLSQDLLELQSFN